MGCGVGDPPNAKTIKNKKTKKTFDFGRNLVFERYLNFVLLSSFLFQMLILMHNFRTAV
jgi:hypothetical protein